MEYKLNKGVGQDVEFCGLKAQYLYLFAGGLLAVFLVFVILYMAGVNRWFCIALCVVSATGITLGVFRLNRKYVFFDYIVFYPRIDFRRKRHV